MPPRVRPTTVRHSRGYVEQHSQAAAFGILLGGEGVVLRFVHRAPQPHHRHGGRRPDDERDPPAPRMHLVRGEQLLQDDLNTEREQLTAGERHVLERGVEAAPVRRGDFAQIRRRGSVLTAQRQPLQQPRCDQQHRCQRTDLRISGQDGDAERADAHQRHRERQRRAASVSIGVPAEEPSAEGPDQEADCEDACRIHKLRSRIARREEHAGEVDAECRVGIPVVPLDQIAERSANNVACHRSHRCAPSLLVGAQII